ncbi:MAG TPA: alpha/beta hydrolase [Vicinamibacterales bacterium]|nr:alpha/beta hydrolase [Vicinamibacterales bacterium]
MAMSKSTIGNEQRVEAGSGAAVVLVPGIQGRWEWMRATVEALARRCRVITFSHCGEPGSGVKLHAALGVDNFVRQIDAVLDRAGLERAAICGISLGGLVALRYAALRPARVSALILVSVPGPRWRPDRVQAFCARYWPISPPVFAASAIARLWREVIRAHGGLLRALPFALVHVWRVLAHRASVWRMHQRYELWLAAREQTDYAAIAAPTLIVTGERELDRVVPVEGTVEYARCIPGARTATLEGTGHIGLVTRPRAFAEMVAGFVEDAARSRARGDSRSAAR